MIALCLVLALCLFWLCVCFGSVFVLARILFWLWVCFGSVLVLARILFWLCVCFGSVFVKLVETLCVLAQPQSGQRLKRELKRTQVAACAMNKKALHENPLYSFIILVRKYLYFFLENQSFLESQIFENSTP